MFVFGVGMGLIMQVLVVAVQNAVSYEDLGVATSSATFFRMIGGSFGTAVFGAIYAIVLNHTIAPTLAKVPSTLLKSFNPQTINPSVLGKLKSTAEGLLFYTKYIDAVTHAIQIVFLVAVPIAFVAFLLSFLLPEVELRKTVQTVDVGEVNGMPDPRSSLREMELALTRLSDRENRVELYQTLAQRAGIDLPPRSVWLLYRLADQPACTVNDVARRLKVGSDLIQPGVDGLLAAGMIEERRAWRGVRSLPHECRHGGPREADRGPPSGADRAARGLEPRGAPRDHRDGEGPRPLPAGRRQAPGGRRHAACGGRGRRCGVGGWRAEAAGR